MASSNEAPADDRSTSVSFSETSDTGVSVGDVCAFEGDFTHVLAGKIETAEYRLGEVLIVPDRQLGSQTIALEDCKSEITPVLVVELDSGKRVTFSSSFVRRMKPSAVGTRELGVLEIGGRISSALLGKSVAVLARENESGEYIAMSAPYELNDETGLVELYRKGSLAVHFSELVVLRQSCTEYGPDQLVPPLAACKVLFQRGEPECTSSRDCNSHECHFGVCTNNAEQSPLSEPNQEPLPE